MTRRVFKINGKYILHHNMSCTVYSTVHTVQTLYYRVQYCRIQVAMQKEMHGWPTIFLSANLIFIIIIIFETTANVAPGPVNEGRTWPSNGPQANFIQVKAQMYCTVLYCMCTVLYVYCTVQYILVRLGCSHGRHGPVIGNTKTVKQHHAICCALQSPILRSNRTTEVLLDQFFDLCAPS